MQRRRILIEIVEQKLAFNGFLGLQKNYSSSCIQSKNTIIFINYNDVIRFALPDYLNITFVQM